MFRTLSTLVAAGLAATPLPALAQNWLASGATSTPTMAPRQDGVSLATTRVAAWSTTHLPRSQERRRIVIRQDAPAESRKTPEVEVRARDEWLNDEGLQIGLGGLAYKERF